MTPPEAPVTGQAPETGAPQAASSRLEVMRKRADFLLAARAKRSGQPGMLVQGRDRGDGAALRVGFTCSKKIGNAVIRNRAKRRLREVARIVLPEQGHAGWDYVLVGRPETTVTRPFAELTDDLRRALRKIHP